MRSHTVRWALDDRYNSNAANYKAEQPLSANALNYHLLCWSNETKTERKRRPFNCMQLVTANICSHFSFSLWRALRSLASSMYVCVLAPFLSWAEGIIHNVSALRHVRIWTMAVRVCATTTQQVNSLRRTAVRSVARSDVCVSSVLSSCSLLSVVFLYFFSRFSLSIVGRYSTFFHYFVFRAKDCFQLSDRTRIKNQFFALFKSLHFPRCIRWFQFRRYECFFSLRYMRVYVYCVCQSKEKWKK